MKLKYKKIILLITMSTMAIGMVTFSIGSSSKNNSSKIDNISNNNETKETLAQNNNKQLPEISNPIENDNEPEDKENTPQREVEKPASVTSGDTTQSDNANIETEDLQLKRDAYPQVNELIRKYLDARVACDLDEIKKLVNDTSSITLSNLQESSKYIEEYKTIDCYTVDGPEPGTYVVYVYEEIKILGVDTLAPGMGLFYVCTDENNKPYIFFGEIKDEINQFIDDTRNLDEVQKLIDTVNKKLDEAKTNDEELGEFQKNIEKKNTNNQE